eukprot:gene36253-44723_t
MLAEPGTEVEGRACTGRAIWATSTEGYGSSFHVVLPMTPALSQPAQQRAAPCIKLAPLNILAADDVPQNLELLTLLLGKQGHTITGASDGAIAVQLAAEGRFDETQLGRPRVPIIAMTASVLEKDREATNAAGMEGFAPKPVDMHVLGRELAMVLGIAIDEQAQTSGPETLLQVLNHQHALLRWAGEERAYHRALRSFAADRAGAENQDLHPVVEPRGEVVGLVMDVAEIAVGRALHALVGADPHRAHADVGSGLQVDGDVVGEGGAGRIDAMLLHQRVVDLRMRLGPVFARGDVEDRLEVMRHAQPLHHALGV